MFASCSNQDTPATAQTDKNELGVSAVISGAVSTRALTDGFAATNTIGVFIDNTIGTETDYTPLVAAYTFGATTWAPPASGKIYLTNQGATVYAFYPSNSVVDTAAKTLAIAVDAAQDFSATSQTDYMYGTAARTGSGTVESPFVDPLAVASNATSANEVALYFHHALSKLSFVVNRASSYTGAGVLTSVKLKKTTGFLAGATGGTVLLNDGVISGLVAADSLTFTGTTTINTVAALGAVLVQGLVAPIVATSGITLTLTIDGKDMLVTLPAVAPADAWLQGNNYTYTINVLGTELSVVSVAITVWNSIVGGTTEVN